MKCPSCNNSLDMLLNANIPVLACPFCKSDLDWDTLTLTPENALERLVKKHGKTIFLSADLLQKSIEAWPPSLKNVRCRLEVLNVFNIPVALAKALSLNASAQKNNIEECVATLTECLKIPRQSAENLIGDLVGVLGLNANNEQKTGTGKEDVSNKYLFMDPVC